jgi:FemAB-related protein (PEP-CTERM system-associated)
MPSVAPEYLAADPTIGDLALTVVRGDAVARRLSDWQAAFEAPVHPARDLRWLPVLKQGLRHEVHVVEARVGQTLAGVLPLAFVKSLAFGRLLVSLPYVNSAGPIAARAAAEQGDDDVAWGLIGRAVQLADELRVRYLELRHEREISHDALTETMTSKVHMRLPLPETADALWASFKSKLRSQIKSGEKHEFAVAWGGAEQLDAFYRVFSRNMRDLGTPVYSRAFFAAILKQFGADAELCVLRLRGAPVAAALVVHGRGVAETTSASTLREFNGTNANMVMYWNLLVRAIERGQRCFDFGRGTIDAGTYRFKKQWGAEPSPAIWQYYVRKGSIQAARPENEKFRLAIRAWQKLPVWLANVLGPPIVRGIP